MPSSVELEQEHGDDVAIVFIEAQSASIERIESYAFGKNWLPYGMWTKEQPFKGGNLLPHKVVLGIHGEVIYSGNSSSKVEELVAEQVKLAKKGPKELTPSCLKAWLEYEKGNFAAAITALDAVAAGAEKDIAKRLAASFRTRTKAKIARLDWLIENAQFARADELAAELVKGTAGMADLAASTKTVADKLAAANMPAERDAAKSLDRVQKKIDKDGLDDAALKQLAAVAEKHPNTRAAKRAAHLVQLLGG